MTKNVDIDLTNLPPEQHAQVVAGALHAILKYANDDDSAVRIVGQTQEDSQPTTPGGKLDFISPTEN